MMSRNDATILFEKCVNFGVLQIVSLRQVQKRMVNIYVLERIDQMF